MAAMLLSENTINAGETQKNDDSKNSTGRRTRSSVRVALIRATPIAGDLTANWATFEHFARQAADKTADICISPECFLDGYAVAHSNWSRERLIEGGRTAAKEYLPRLKKLASELKIMLLFGTTYTTGRYCYNSAFFIGPDGQEIGRYDKTHLLDHDLRFNEGKKLPVFDTPFGKVGIMICADRRWPETARTLRVQGAQLILNPTYGMKHLKNEWWMRTRSYENECYICFTHPTVSLVTDPKGDIHAKSNSKEPGLLVTDIDLSGIPTKMFDARRPKLYAPITRVE
jgi:predicted amidohydrolase